MKKIQICIYFFVNIIFILFVEASISQKSLGQEKDAQMANLFECQGEKNFLLQYQESSFSMLGDGGGPVINIRDHDGSLHTFHYVSFSSDINFDAQKNKNLVFSHTQKDLESGNKELSSRATYVMAVPEVHVLKNKEFVSLNIKVLKFKDYLHNDFFKKKIGDIIKNNQSEVMHLRCKARHVVF